LNLCREADRDSSGFCHHRKNYLVSKEMAMKFKPLMFGLPLLAGLTLMVGACESQETEIETPTGETEIEQPAESPIDSPAVSPSPTTSPTTP
jgi:hypothetical protein